MTKNTTKWTPEQLHLLAATDVLESSSTRAEVFDVVFEDYHEQPQEAIADAYVSKYQASSPWSLRRAFTPTFTIEVLPSS